MGREPYFGSLECVFQAYSFLSEKGLLEYGALQRIHLFWIFP